MQLGKDKICVISLCETIKTDKLICKRHIIPLPTHDEKPLLSYHAISYVWGPKHLRSKVLVEDEESPILVSATLEPALRNIWKRWPQLYLWCDALCIDQQDKQEKSQQVANMGNIYSAAERVLIWFGSPEDGTSAAFKVLRRATENLQTEDDMSQSPNMVNLIEARSLRAFSYHPWFYRAWTFQEISLARSALLVGDRDVDVLDWRELQSAVVAGWELDEEGRTEILDVSDEEIFSFGLGFILQMSNRFVHDVTALQPASSNILSDLLLQTWARESYDARDKVYAVAGTARARRIDFGLSIDYTNSKTVRKLFIETARTCMNIDRSLKILQIAGLEYSRKFENIRLPTLFRDKEYVPSWVPDWRCFAGAPRLNAFATWYIASASHQTLNYFTLAESPPLQSADDFSELLKLRGVALGVIQDSSPIFPPRNVNTRTEQDFGHFSLYSLPRARNQSGPDNLEVVSSILRDTRNTHGACTDCGFFSARAINIPNDYGAVTHRLGFKIGNRENSTTADGQENNAWLPNGSSAGDWLCLLEGGSLPFVLRPLMQCKYRRGMIQRILGETGVARPTGTFQSYSGSGEAFVLIGGVSGNWNHHLAILKEGRWPSTFASGTFVLT